MLLQNFATNPCDLFSLSLENFGVNIYLENSGAWDLQGGKYYDMSTIYHWYIVYRYNISWKNIGLAKFREKSQKIGGISRYIDNFGDKLPIFPDISHGQHGSTTVKRATVKSMRYSAWKNALSFVAEGIWTPNQKLWGSTYLPSGQAYPCYIICTKHI